MGKISVIIPVYNTEQYLMKCVESLWEQTYKNIEILLINDNSNEKCTYLLETLSKQDNRIKLFHFKENKGVGSARNFGIEKASGDYIYFLDSDDYIPYKTLEMLIKNINNNNMIRGRMRTTNFSTSIAIIYHGLFNIKLFIEEKYNLIKNNTALNFLFKKDFIINKELSFSESVNIYSELEFMIPALIHTEQVPYLKEAIYFKRKRNDPITNPSLKQSDVALKIKEFISVYNKLKVKYNDELANDFLDKQFLNFYRKDIITFFKNNEGIDECFEELMRAVRRVNPDMINDHGWVLKKELDAINSGKIKGYKRINARHHLLRQIREGLKSKNNFYTLLYNTLFMKSKVKEKLIFFESFQGRSYSDSPKYIYEYMINNNMNYKYVWSTTEKQIIPGNPIQVRRFSLRYFYYIAKAKYWISNSRLPKYIKKRKDNIYLQTWHGTPLKRLAADMDDVYMPGTNSASYKLNFLNETQKWDYLVSPNAYSSKIFKRAFWFNNTMIESGYPRNDILYNGNTEKNIITLKKKLNIPLNKKVILYAPTWRDDEFYSKGKYRFTLQLDLQKMQEQLGNEYVVLLRMHYFIASQMDISEFEGFAYDFSNHNDIGELYLISDILITDYSSVFFDFAHLKRPILFYTYDLEKYRDQLRGFYINIEKDVPGPLVNTTKEVIHSIKNIDVIQIKYENRYDTFYERFCKWDDGNASRKVIESVFVR